MYKTGLNHHHLSLWQAQGRSCPFAPATFALDWSAPQRAFARQPYPNPGDSCTRIRSKSLPNLVPPSIHESERSPDRSDLVTAFVLHQCWLPEVNWFRVARWLVLLWVKWPFCVCWPLLRLFSIVFLWRWRRNENFNWQYFLILRARIICMQISWIYRNLAVVGLFLSKQTQHRPRDQLSAVLLLRCYPGTPQLFSSFFRHSPPNLLRHLPDVLFFYSSFLPDPYLFSFLFYLYLIFSIFLLWTSEQLLWWDL